MGVERDGSGTERARTGTVLSHRGGERENRMKKTPRLSFTVFFLILLSASASMAIDTTGMARQSDSLFSRNGMKTKTVCTDQQATIILFDNEDGRRPSVDEVIDTLAVVGKSFNREFGTDYFYKMSVYYDGREWVETLAGNCRDSFLDNTISHCFYKVHFE